ncbi:hypothetical protein OG381_34275 [Streptomyces sp. NBC_00490]
MQVRARLHLVATLQTTWTCVYPGCGASFSAYVDMAAHLSTHYS